MFGSMLPLFLFIFIFFLHYMLSNGNTVYDDAGGQWWMMTCNGDLLGICGFQDVVHGKFAWIRWSSGYSQ